MAGLAATTSTISLPSRGEQGWEAAITVPSNSFQWGRAEVWKEQFARLFSWGRGARRSASRTSPEDESSKCLHVPNPQLPQALAWWLLLCTSTGKAPTWSKAGLKRWKGERRWFLPGRGIPQLNLFKPGKPLQAQMHMIHAARQGWPRGQGEEQGPSSTSFTPQCCPIPRLSSGTGHFRPGHGRSF